MFTAGRTSTLRYFGYWVRLEIAVVAIAGLMSLIGTFVWSATLPRPFFAVREMVLPSCLTWALLAPLAAKASLRQALLIGVASPFAGAVFAILLRLGPVKDVVFENMNISGFIGLLIYAWSYIGITAWTTLPVGLTTGFLVHRVFVWYPAPKAQISSQAQRVTITQRSSWRYTLTAVPLLLLLALSIPLTRTVDAWWYVHILVPLRLLAELFFAPVTMLVMMTMVGLNALVRIPSFDGALVIFVAVSFLLKSLYSAGVALLIYRRS